MNEVVIFLSNNKIVFNTQNSGTYTIIVSMADETQSGELIDLAEAQGLKYKIQGGLCIYELPEPKKQKKKK